MRKTFSIVLAFAMVILLFPVEARAASASFSISGPGSLQTGQTGTYTVKVSVNDASAAQATLSYDSNFFELVSGSTIGEWDTSSNTNTTETLITVTLRCKADVGTSGSLSVTGAKVVRFTGGDPPSETVACGGASKTVSNPVPTPTPEPTPVPTPVPTPTKAPAVTAKRPSTQKPSKTLMPTATQSMEPSPSPDPDLTPVPDPTATPDPWTVISENIAGAQTSGPIKTQILGDTHMPVSILEQLKETQEVLVMDFGDYTCTIDGADLNNIPEDSDSIDLAVSMEKDEALSETADGNDVYQLHFNYHGELPGKFTYKIKAIDSQPGDTLYLYYYYDDAGVVEGMQSAVVDETGFVSFEIYHCSSYFVSDQIIERAVNHFAAAEVIAPVQDTQTSGISVFVFILSITCTALISVIATMFFYKKGIFEKIINQSPETPE